MTWTPRKIMVSAQHTCIFTIPDLLGNYEKQIVHCQNTFLPELERSKHLINKALRVDGSTSRHITDILKSIDQQLFIDNHSITAAIQEAEEVKQQLSRMGIS